MIDWKTIKPLLKSLVIELTQLDDKRVRWRDEPEGSTWAAEPMVYLRARGIDGFGIGEEITDELPDGTQEVSVCVQKSFTLSMRVESFTQDVSDPNFAGNVLERFKTRRWRTSTVERMHKLLSILTWTPTVWFDYLDNDGRQVSCYNADFVFGAADNDIDTTPGAGDVIEETIVQGTVTSDGTPIAVNLDVKAT